MGARGTIQLAPQTERLFTSQVLALAATLALLLSVEWWVRVATAPALASLFTARAFAGGESNPCSLPNASRNQFDAASLGVRGVRLLRDEAGTLRFPHSLPDPDCPRYIVFTREESAGIGHRVHEWITSLWLALTFNLTLVYEPVGDIGTAQKSSHGSYEGWDVFLGLSFGENPQNGLLGQHIRLPDIKGWSATTAEVLAAWAPLLSPFEAPCNVVFHSPANLFPGDVSAVVRPYLTWKFAAAAAARARAGVQLPLRYSPSAVNVAVHLRVGDAHRTPEAALWTEAQLVLQRLRAAGVRGLLQVHVFTEGSETLTHFGHAALLGHEGAEIVRVYHHTDVAANETLWHFANADVFLGSHSSFSWLAGLLSPRFLGLMQRKPGRVEYCPDRGVSLCCAEDGVCTDPGGALLRAAQRISAADACGNIGPHTAVFSETWPLEVGEPGRGHTVR